jgi:glycosyltransferase involved in cell wall biosynthesis
MKRSVTIVVRSFNYDRFLRAAIESALSQTAKDVEVVVVDDGSSDGSVAIIESYGDRVVAVLKENGGMASAFAAGMQASSGEFLVFLDSDDLLFPEAIERALPLMQRGVTKIHWPLIEIDESGARTGVINPGTALPEGDLIPALIAAGPTASNGPPMSGNAWSRDFLDSATPLPDPRISAYADTYLSLLAAIHGRVGRVTEPLGCYRRHGGNQYGSLPWLDKLERNLSFYKYRCGLLSERLERLGEQIDASAWMAGNASYDRLASRHSVFLQVADMVPSGGRFILVDVEASGPGTMFGDRSMVRLPSALDDDAAAALVGREQAGGACALVFIRPGLGWLRDRPKLRAQLDARYRRLIESNRLIVFDLRTAIY